MPHIAIERYLFTITQLFLNHPIISAKNYPGEKKLNTFKDHSEER